MCILHANAIIRGYQKRMKGMGPTLVDTLYRLASVATAMNPVVGIPVVNPGTTSKLKDAISGEPLDGCRVIYTIRVHSPLDTKPMFAYWLQYTLRDNTTLGIPAVPSVGSPAL